MTRNEMLIRIKPTSLQIETVRDGRTEYKSTSIEALKEVLTRSDSISTPLLPSVWGTQLYEKKENKEMYLITTPPGQRTVFFEDDGEILEFETAVPALLWIIFVKNLAKGEKEYIHGAAYALKNQLLSLEDQLYRFPFANVDDRWMCWGSSSEYPTLSTAKSIMTIPDRFLSNPFNFDLDTNKFKPFEHKFKGSSEKVKLFQSLHLFKYYDEKIKKAKKEGEKVTFDTDILITHKPTIREQITDLQRQFMN